MRLDLLHPNTAQHVGKKQLEQKEGQDKKARSRVFHVAVFARNFRNCSDVKPLESKAT